MRQNRGFFKVFSKFVLMPAVVITFIFCLYIGNFNIDFYIGIHPIVAAICRQYDCNEWIVCILSIAPPRSPGAGF